MALALLSLSAPAQAADAGPTTVGTAHFELTSTCDADTRSAVLRRLEAFRSALEILVLAATGVALGPNPVRITLFEEPREYAAYADAHAPGLGHNGGYYDGQTRTVYTYRRSNPMQLHFHEITHAVMGDVFGDPWYERYARPGWPVWFDEGFAEYASSYAVDARGATRFGALHAARLATLVDALETRRLIPMALLLRARAGDFSGGSMDLWYAQAWGLVDLLLAEADLRGRVPVWVQRLRDGENGVAAFLAVFGPDLDRLQARFERRIGRLAASSPRPMDLLGPGGLDAWTMHEGGDWRVDGDDIVGRSTGGWNYLTRAIPPVQAFALELEVRLSGEGSLGLVLGHHGVGAYPYHTIVDLGGGRASLRHIRTPERLTRRVEGPAPLREDGYTPVRVELRHGVLSVWVDGRHVLSARPGRPVASLVGLYVQEGTARFRGLFLAPVPGYATGPSAAQPPASLATEPAGAASPASSSCADDPQ
ncbi:MAG: hypothetical protein H6746_06690 [Deltaproteobacteria bacterium]|nr:hypothetical protein [Deltaproteobacteria bacterium]